MCRDFISCQSLHIFPGSIQMDETGEWGMCRALRVLKLELCCLGPWLQMIGYLWLLHSTAGSSSHTPQHFTTCFTTEVCHPLPFDSFCVMCWVSWHSTLDMIMLIALFILKFLYGMYVNFIPIWNFLGFSFSKTFKPQTWTSGFKFKNTKELTFSTKA